MTDRLKRAIEESKADPDRFHQRLFFALCRDLNDFTIHQNSVPAVELLDLVADYAPAEYNSSSPDEERGADS